MDKRRATGLTWTVAIAFISLAFLAGTAHARESVFSPAAPFPDKVARADSATAVAAKKCKRHHHKRKCRKSQPATSTAPTATAPAATAPTTTAPTTPPPSPHTLSVANEGNGFGVVESSPAGIRCPSPSCVASFDPGTMVTLTPAAETNSHFDHWSGACTGSGPCQVTMDADKAVSAVFSQDLRTLSVKVTSNYTPASDGGAVTTDVGSINCREGSGTCSEQYPYGTIVTLKGEAAEGWGFWGWGGGTCSGFTPTCQIIMDASRSVTADFIDS